MFVDPNNRKYLFRLRIPLQKFAIYKNSLVLCSLSRSVEMSEVEIGSDSAQLSRMDGGGVERGESCPFVSILMELRRRVVFTRDCTRQRLEWVFGCNPEVPMINLTGRNAPKTFAVASGHVVQVVGCEGNEMQSYVGHVSRFGVRHSRTSAYLERRFVVTCRLFCRLGECRRRVGGRSNRSLHRVS